MKRFLFALSFLFLGMICSTSTQAQEKVDSPVDFNRDIRPLLSDRCFQCHGPDADHREADLRFDQDVGDESPYADRDGTQVIAPGKPEKSTLWLRLITDDESEVMPPPDSKKPAFSAAEKQLIKKWIEAGAKFDTHWAFKTPVAPDPPKSKSQKWNNNAIDQFAHEKLSAEGIAPKPRADRRTLIRRLTFDLTGLPPTLAEIKAFVDDSSDNAYEKLVDRLLGQPSYGEHMARYWLDLVRFADTNGIHHDHYREVTPYRDWVIRSFNANLPFDQFVKYQIAGDLYPEPTTDQLIASGFNRLHLVIDRGTALPEESFHRNVVDRVTAFGTVFMGLTVQCAQCHEHKYDPISQEEFYELYAFFNNIDASPETPGGRQHPPLLQVPTPAQQTEIDALREKLNALQARLKSIEQESSKSKSAEDEEIKKSLEAKVIAAKTLVDSAKKQLDAAMKSVPTTLIMKERKDVRETRVRIRGAYDQMGNVVTRNTPDFLPPLQKSGEVPSRLDLARWVTSPNHPLTARVAVNRIWQQFFGIGLVKTSEDFGAQGQPPSHPRLLDHLATQFIDSEWNVKALVKSIVMSETYQQSSVATPEEFLRDRDNRLLARGARFRLDAETIRDQILMVSGLLNREMYGKSVKPPQPPNLWKSVSMRSSNTYSFRADGGEKIVRRSVYSFWKRAMPPPQMTIFDAPTRESCIARRERTNTPLQALVLMNEEQYFNAAKHWAIQVIKQHADDEKRIKHLYESLTAKTPDSEEMNWLLRGLNELRENYVKDPKLKAEICEGFDVEKEQMADLAAYATLINSLFNLDIVKTRN